MEGDDWYCNGKSVWRVQVRKRGGRYRTRVMTQKRAQAWLLYDGINIGTGYAKRLLCDGVTVAHYSAIGVTA